MALHRAGQADAERLCRRLRRPAAGVAVADPSRSKTTTGSSWRRDQTAGFEILDHAAVAVKKNQRFAGAPLHIVQPNAVDVEEAAGGRIFTLRFLSEMTIDERRLRPTLRSQPPKPNVRRRLCVAKSDRDGGTRASNRAQRCHWMALGKARTRNPDHPGLQRQVNR